MRYEKPEMKVLELEAEDIITLSNGGMSVDDGSNPNQGSTDVSGSGWNH